MKTILGAFALVIAAPVAAQTAPAADPHAGHAQHQQQGHQQHGEHADHKMDYCKEGCCEKMKQEGKTMPCCEKHGEGHEGQQGHGSRH